MQHHIPNHQPPSTDSTGPSIGHWHVCPQSVLACAATRYAPLAATVFRPAFARVAQIAAPEKNQAPKFATNGKNTETVKKTKIKHCLPRQNCTLNLSSLNNASTLWGSYTKSWGPGWLMQYSCRRVRFLRLRLPLQHKKFLDVLFSKKTGLWW